MGKRDISARDSIKGLPGSLGSWWPRRRVAGSLGGFEPKITEKTGKEVCGSVYFGNTPLFSPGTYNDSCKAESAHLWTQVSENKEMACGCLAPSSGKRIHTYKCACMNYNAFTVVVNKANQTPDTYNVLQSTT